jgi:hypothetical protein
MKAAPASPAGAQTQQRAAQANVVPGCAFSCMKLACGRSLQEMVEHPIKPAGSVIVVTLPAVGVD